jgi:hypothetical protein
MESNAVDRPVFLRGPHRSGTTLVYKFLARHPDAAWFTAADRRLENAPALAHAAARLGLGAYPHEAQRIWDRFRDRDDDVMGAADAAPKQAAWHRRRVLRVLELRGRTRFVAKYPRLSLRLDWLDAVFPGALYLHVVRDWRAVVNSTVSRRVKREGREGDLEWFGVRIPGWRELDALPHPVAAGRIYRHVTLHLEKETERYGPRLRRVRYEEFCADPVAASRGIADWAGLRWTPEFEEKVRRPLKARNDKWKTGLGEKVVADIRAEDPAFYARYEFM